MCVFGVARRDKGVCGSALWRCAGPGIGSLQVGLGVGNDGRQLGLRFFTQLVAAWELAF